MIKAKLDGANGPLYLIGLSDLDVARLRAGHSVTVSASAIGLDADGDVVIMHGETEHALIDDLLDRIGGER